jgi:putative transposase
VLIDEFATECVAIEAGRSFTAGDVIIMTLFISSPCGHRLSICRATTGRSSLPKTSRNDRRERMFARSTSQKSSPWENGYLESFNGRLHDELLDRKVSLSLPEARVVLASCGWTTTIYDRVVA